MRGSDKRRGEDPRQSLNQQLVSDAMIPPATFIK
jgi:hypothetical protein